MLTLDIYKSLLLNAPELPRDRDYHAFALICLPKAVRHYHRETTHIKRTLRRTGELPLTKADKRELAYILGAEVAQVTIEAANKMLQTR